MQKMPLFSQKNTNCNLELIKVAGSVKLFTLKKKSLRSVFCLNHMIPLEMPKTTKSILEWSHHKRGDIKIEKSQTLFKRSNGNV